MKRGTESHPKLKRLARVLGIHRAQALGHLELLWQFTAAYAPRGDVGRHDDIEIEEGALWDGELGQLVQALVACGWLEESPEHRLIVHEWDVHATNACRLSLSRRGEDTFASGAPIRRARNKVETQKREWADLIPEEREQEREQEQEQESRQSQSLSRQKRKRSSAPKKAPKPWPEDGLTADELFALERWAAEKGFPTALVDAKVEAIRDWALANNKKKADWIATIRGAIRRDHEEKQNNAQDQRPGLGSSHRPGGIERAAAGLAARGRLGPPRS